MRQTFFCLPDLMIKVADASGLQCSNSHILNANVRVTFSCAFRNRKPAVFWHYLPTRCRRTSRLSPTANVMHSNDRKFSSFSFFPSCIQSSGNRNKKVLQLTLPHLGASDSRRSSLVLVLISSNVYKEFKWLPLRDFSLIYSHLLLTEPSFSF